MASDLDKLFAYLEVERIDTYLFIGKSPKRPARVFGGQVAAQALNAAARSVDADRIAHSMHAYFLRPGDPSKQIVYEVDPIRDGNSFNTRRVVAKQDGIAIFNTAVSFQVQEEGLSHQSTAPDVVGPEDLESDFEYWTRLSEKNPDKFPAPTLNSIERRPIDRRDELNPSPREPSQYTWVRGRGDLGDDLVKHQTLLAFMSDFALLSTSLYPHPYSGWSESIQGASLDHAIWFHRPFRADEYLLYCIDSPNSAAGRGFSRGSFYNQEGVLVASTAQESLIRLRD